MRRGRVVCWGLTFSEGFGSVRIPRSASLILLVLVATPWAVVLAAYGLSLLLDASPSLPGFRPAGLAGGVTVFAAGQLVFSACVADRLFPRASRGLVWWMEIVTCGLLFAGCAFLMLSVADMWLTSP